MSQIKFTGANISAAVLILFYFFPWVSMAPISLSGFAITTNGISPGMLSYFISGFGRIYMILAVLVPLSAAIILYQNITGNNKFAKYYKPAYFIPALYLIIGIIGLHFKMKPDIPDVPEGYKDMYNQMSSGMRDMTPGIFDIMSFATYIILIASIYLLLVKIGTIKDKEYYKPAVTPPSQDNKSAPPTEEKRDNG